MDTIETNETVDFILKKVDGKEQISCNLNKNVYSIDFTSNDQSKLRDFFLIVLKKLESGKFHFKYVKDSDFSNSIFEKVAEEYISGLNKEIDSIYTEIESIKN